MRAAAANRHVQAKTSGSRPNFRATTTAAFPSRWRRCPQLEQVSEPQQEAPPGLQQVPGS